MIVPVELGLRLRRLDTTILRSLLLESLFVNWRLAHPCQRFSPGNRDVTASSNRINNQTLNGQFTDEGSRAMSITPSEACAHFALLRRLYQGQAASGKTNPYLAAHSHSAVIKHHVNVIGWSRRFLPKAGGT